MLGHIFLTLYVYSRDFQLDKEVVVVIECKPEIDLPTVWSMSC